MMKNETLGLEKLEISDLIRELRVEKNVQQNVLYDGLCGRKKYFQLENGDVIVDELLSERLFSRLHVQYHLVDIMLDDKNFWQKECRYEINLQIHKKCWERAERLLGEYEIKAPKTGIHRQYVLEKRAEISYQMKLGQSGRLFREALELTMSVPELEERLKKSGLVAEDEFWMYFRYRTCENPFSAEEYELFLEKLEEWFLCAQIYTEVYFEAAYQYVCELWKAEQYVKCREICGKAIAWLKRGMKNFHLAEFYFFDAIAGMKRVPDAEEEKKLFQQCKMAYYVSMSFGDREMAERIETYCGEELKWRITVQVK